MNSSNISKLTESLTITSSSHLNKNRIKPVSKLNFLSAATYTKSFFKKPYKHDNLKYRQTIDNFLNSSSNVDLMKQSHLSQNEKIPINKNYLVNLVKMRIKKNNHHFPKIETFKTFSPNYHYIKTFSFDFRKYNTSNQFHTMTNNTTKKSNKEKVKEIYKKIYDDNNSTKLKQVYVNHLMNKDKISGEKNEDTNVNIRPKLINNINYNFINSEKRFMKYHGFNKRKKFKYNLELFDIKKDKYPNKSSAEVMQLFLNNKLKILNKDMKIAKSQFETAKNNLVSVYYSFNQRIQSDIDEAYGSTK